MLGIRLRHRGPTLTDTGRLRALLLAPPGAGKGTQALRIAEHFDVPHISTGDLFRAAIAAGTELGQEVAAYVEAGDLVPDDVVVRVVAEAVRSAVERAGGYLLDGFPRDLEQARAGYRIARELGATVHAVVHYAASEEVLEARLVDRGHHEGRVDDTEQTIRHRFEVFHSQTEPLLDYYRQRGVLVTIDAERSVDEVTAESIAALQRALDGSPA